MKIIKINFRKLKFIVCDTFKASTQTGKVFIYRLYFIFIACFHIFTYECNQYCARLRYFYLRVSWSFWNSVSFLFWNDWIRNRISNMTALSLNISAKDKIWSVFRLFEKILELEQKFEYGCDILNHITLIFSISSTKFSWIFLEPMANERPIEKFHENFSTLDKCPIERVRRYERSCDLFYWKSVRKDVRPWPHSWPWSHWPIISRPRDTSADLSYD